MQKGVILFARPREPHAAALEAEFARRRRPVLRINPATYPRRRRLSLSIGRNVPVALQLDDQEVIEPGAGWNGTQRIVRLDGSIDRAARRFAKSASMQGLDSFLRAMSIPWVNDHHAALLADDKFNQLVVAKRLGFTIPETLFTNDPQKFRSFFRQQNDIVAKSASGSAGLRDDKRILTQRLRAHDINAADAVRLAPVLFQNYVPKSTELRVTVVGDQVFPVRIHSQDSARTRTDWRRYAPEMRYSVASLPRHVKEQCIRISRELDLAYGGIDLVETPNGEFVFLEINSLPAWLWLEETTKLPITAAVATHIERQIGRSASEAPRKAS